MLVSNTSDTPDNPMHPWKKQSEVSRALAAVYGYSLQIGAKTAPVLLRETDVRQSSDKVRCSGHQLKTVLQHLLLTKYRRSATQCNWYRNWHQKQSAGSDWIGRSNQCTCQPTRCTDHTHKVDVLAAALKLCIFIPRIHDRANIELARRAMVISMLIKKAGGL